MNDNNACQLGDKTCQSCEGGVPPLTQDQIINFLGKLSGWEQTGMEITKLYRFRNYFETISFVNATAWISHHEDHHPDLEVSYNQCLVHYSTHAIGGLSENDFICAAKIDRLFNAKIVDSEH